MVLLLVTLFTNDCSSMCKIDHESRRDNLLYYFWALPNNIALQCIIIISKELICVAVIYGISRLFKAKSEG